jgi:hypothetical protein
MRPATRSSHGIHLISGARSSPRRVSPGICPNTQGIRPPRLPMAGGPWALIPKYGIARHAALPLRTPKQPTATPDRPVLDLLPSSLGAHPPEVSKGVWGACAFERGWNKRMAFLREVWARRPAAGFPSGRTRSPMAPRGAGDVNGVCSTGIVSNVPCMRPLARCTGLLAGAGALGLAGAPRSQIVPPDRGRQLCASTSSPAPSPQTSPIPPPGSPKR